MKIGVFTRGKESHSYKYEKAFRDGLIEHGHDVTFYDWTDRPETIDMAVMWGINNEALIEHLKNKNVDYVVLERGYIGDREKWTSCGFNGLNGHADFCNENSDDKRLVHVEKYFKHERKCKVKTLTGYTLIIGQVPSDASVKHVGFNKWLQRAYDQAVRYDSHYYDIYYRPHPLEKEPFVPEGLKVLEGSLGDALKGAVLVVTLNSNTGVDAMMLGVNVSCHDKGSMIYDVPLVGRGQWLKDMSYTQWTIEEMASGETWGHLKKRYVNGL